MTLFDKYINFGQNTKQHQLEGAIMATVAAETKNSAQIEKTLFFETQLDSSLFQRIAKRIAKEENLSVEDASKILDGTIGFLLLCAADPTGTYSPSPLVDIGWHAFLMYTREYAKFCDTIAGRFIHHNPCDIEGEVGPLARNTPMAFTKHSIPFHADQWKLSSADCNNHCENNDGCKSKVTLAKNGCSVDCEGGDCCSIQSMRAQTCSGSGCMNNG